MSTPQGTFKGDALRRILVVDNDAVFRATLEDFLTEEGYSCQGTGDPTEARRILARREVDLAIIDIRLTSDSDDKDVSGLMLAKASTPDIPKIILTEYPTVEVVRESLGPTADGPPVAVAFVAKHEGFEVLLRYVTFALIMLPRSIGDKLHAAFGVGSSVALPGKITSIGVQDATERILGIPASEWL
jgi:CheY-like chemotaxis protein